uniref:PD-(D/E)XK nuclease family protein n=1 Tax=Sphingomonas populi TaxID=2484750 RepID=UPI0013EEC2DB|nr:PD-(D/E)XK nuclease family protein [Sphingomonas populi]
MPSGVERLSERLLSLLTQWREHAEGNTLRRRLSLLLETLAPLLRVCAGTPLDAEQLGRLLPALSAVLAERRDAGEAINPWTVSGARRREVRNAAILVALWSSAEVGDAGPEFLGGFLDRCQGRLGLGLPDRNELALGYRMRVENCPGVDGSDRVDLIVETARHLIGIEIKIDAKEGKEQLRRYVEAIDRCAQQLGKDPRVILLAPFPPSRDDVIPAGWSMVRSAAAAALPKRRSEYGFAHHLIAHFAHHVRSF